MMGATSYISLSMGGWVGEAFRTEALLCLGKKWSGTRLGIPAVEDGMIQTIQRDACNMLSMK